jgi:hypothetical protein
MAFLGGTFDATQVEPQGDYQPIPPGEYKVHIIASEMVANSAQTGHMLKLEIEILEGDQAGRKLFDRLNLDNPNAQAVEIAQRTLSAICHAVGKLSVQDSEELHSIPMVAVVKVDPPRSANGKDYGPSNSIKTYKAITSSAPAAKPATSGFKPAAAPSGGGTTPPWKRNAA